MFQITDEFLEQAGFVQLHGDQKEIVRHQAAERVQQRIGEQVAEQLEEDGRKILTQLIEGDLEKSRAILGSIEADFRSSPDFLELQKLGQSNGASDEEIVQEYAVFAWMRHQGIDIASVVEAAMNETMKELSNIRKKALEAVEQID